MKKRASDQLIKEIMNYVQDALGEHGYRKRSEQIFTLDLSEEFLGWLGLNRAVDRGDGALALNPVVGVRYQTLERTLAEITGEAFHAYIPPTVSVNVGYLMPENSYRSWRFEQGDANQQKALDMIAVVEKVGRPFMNSMADLESLTEALEAKRYSLPDDRRFHLSALYHLKGESDLANSQLVNYVAELGDRDDLAAQAYRTFAQKMQVRLS